MTKYLLISDASSMHVYNFLNIVIKDRGFKVYLITHTNTPIPMRNKILFQELGVTLISTSHLFCSDKRDSISRFIKFAYKWWYMFKIGTIDICHIHFLHKQSCLLYLTKLMTIKHLILTYWGSDILRINKEDIEIQEKCFKHADLITLTVSNTFKHFKNTFPIQYHKKAKIIRFPCGGIEAIKSIKEEYTAEECKKILGIPTDKITIALGYNALPEQRHIDCLKQLTTLPNEYKSKLCILLPLQYARIDNEYIRQVEYNAGLTSIDYFSFHQYMDPKEMAILTCATNIYATVRATDAFSNTLKEMLYSGTYIIQGKWLVYEELDEIKWPRYQLDSLNQINKAVIQCIKDYYKQGDAPSCQFIWDMVSPSNVRKLWDQEFSLL
ncbi:MAG: hypothetical protein PARBB_00799 [Parabacteroides distasonis]